MQPKKKTHKRRKPMAEAKVNVVTARERSKAPAATNLVKIVRKREGKDNADNVLLFSEEPQLRSVKTWVPTGFPWLDWVVSDGRGLPVGRAVQLWGKFAVGKSALAQYLIYCFQQANGLALYYDWEHSLDPDHLTHYRVDSERLVVYYPETIESGFDTMFDVLNEWEDDTPLYIGYDSVAQSLPMAEQKAKEFGASTVATVPRAMSKACRKLPRLLSKRNATVVFVNQTRANIGAGLYEARDLRPGGQALDFACSVILRMRRLKKLKRTVKGVEQTTGYLLGLQTDKCRHAPPGRQCEIVLDFKHGPDPVASMHHFLAKNGGIKPAGGKGQKLLDHAETFQKKDWRMFYQENRKAVRKVCRGVLSALSDGSAESNGSD